MIPRKRFWERAPALVPEPSQINNSVSTLVSMARRRSGLRATAPGTPSSIVDRLRLTNPCRRHRHAERRRCLGRCCVAAIEARRMLPDRGRGRCRRAEDAAASRLRKMPPSRGRRYQIEAEDAAVGSRPHAVAATSLRLHICSSPVRRHHEIVLAASGSSPPCSPPPPDPVVEMVVVGEKGGWRCCRVGRGGGDEHTDHAGGSRGCWRRWNRRRRWSCW